MQTLSNNPLEQSMPVTTGMFTDKLSEHVTWQAKTRKYCQNKSSFQKKFIAMEHQMLLML